MADLTPPHGTVYRYRRGCDCDDCCAAWARRWTTAPPPAPDADDTYARSHGIPEGNVRAPHVARALHRGRYVHD